MKVVIVQESFGAGGTTQAMVPLIKRLNDNSIVPLIITFSYQKTDLLGGLKYKIAEKSSIVKKPLLKVLNAAYLNLVSARYQADLVINSNNLSIQIGNKPQIIYLHYPREWNLKQKSYNAGIKKSVTAIFQRLVLSLLRTYLRVKYHSTGRIETWCNSYFTESLAKQLKYYHIQGVAYPIVV